MYQQFPHLTDRCTAAQRAHEAEPMANHPGVVVGVLCEQPPAAFAQPAGGLPEGQPPVAFAQPVEGEGTIAPAPPDAQQCLREGQLMKCPKVGLSSRRTLRLYGNRIEWWMKNQYRGSLPLNAHTRVRYSEASMVLRIRTFYATLALKPPKMAAEHADGMMREWEAAVTHVVAYQSYLRSIDVVAYQSYLRSIAPPQRGGGGDNAFAIIPGLFGIGLLGIQG